MRRELAPFSSRQSDSLILNNPRPPRIDIPFTQPYIFRDMFHIRACGVLNTSHKT